MASQPDRTRTGSIVVLTGAGISADSGLPTFRAQDALWGEFDLAEVATPEGFRNDPAKVHAFYNARRRRLPTVHPNPAHEALPRLEREWPGDVLVVTQNIDDLHERAGSRNLIHMHGEILKVRCTASAKVHCWSDDIVMETPCPCCGEPGRLRPHVVWFGEMPFELDRIYAALAACELFLAIGTSGTVYPAAGFVELVRVHGHGHTVELNLEPSVAQSLFADQIYGRASKVVPDYVEKLLSRLARAPAPRGRMKGAARQGERASQPFRRGRRPVTRNG